MKPTPAQEKKLSLAAIALLLIAFALLAHAISEGIHGNPGLVQRVDAAIIHRLLAMRSHQLTGWANETTALGSTLLISFLTITFALLMLTLKKTRLALHIVLATVGADLLCPLVKTFVERARPEEINRLIHVSGFSFPSGHAVNGAAVYLTLAIIAGRLHRTCAQRLVLFSSAIVIIIAIALSRVYLGAHYPSDVFGGVLLGTAWALALATFEVSEKHVTLALLFALLLPGCKAKWAHHPKGSTECWQVTDGGARILKVDGPTTTSVGVCTGPYSVTSYSEVPGKQCADGNRTEPSVGEVWPVAHDTEVFLASGLARGSFYLDTGCANSVNSVQMYENSSSVTVYYKYYRYDFAGTNTVTTIIADAPKHGIGRGKLDLTVYPPQ